MYRRRVLGTFGSGLLAALGGCSATRTAVDEGPPHPLASAPVTVRVDSVSESDHDLVAITREALDFWERRGARHAGFEPAFDLVTGTDPDVILAFADEPVGCEGVAVDTDEVLGCAPLVGEDHPTDQPLTARVVAGTRPPGLILTTARHELGHLLGLDHHHEPTAVMSSDPADRIPQYDERIACWETVRDARGTAVDAIDLFDAGVSAWNERRYDRAGDRFAEAAAGLGRAMDDLDAARETSASIQSDGTWPIYYRDLVETALEQFEAQLDSAATVSADMQTAADAAEAGDDDRAAEYSERASTELDAFEELPAPTVGDVAGGLGLTRGYDRDEPIFELD